MAEFTLSTLKERTGPPRSTRLTTFILSTEPFHLVVGKRLARLRARVLRPMKVSSASTEMPDPPIGVGFTSLMDSLMRCAMNHAVL